MARKTSSKTPKSISVFSLQPPANNVTVLMDGHTEDAVRIVPAYTLVAIRRPKPSLEPEKSMWKSLRPWNGISVPSLAVFATDGNLIGAQVISWDGRKTVQGSAPWGRPVVGTITITSDGIYAIQTDPNALIEHKRLLEKAAQRVAAEAEAAQPAAIVPTSKDEKMYTGDPFILTEDGHYMDAEELKKSSEKRFTVPKNFDEFWAWKPEYVMNWVKKRLSRFVVDEDVEDWTQDLLIHLRYLPVNSKHRLPGANGRPNGCEDVIETFDPVQQYGASERRFRNYVNNCLANKFNTVRSKRLKNPVCRANTVPFGSAVSSEPSGHETPDDEYIHGESSYLSDAAATAQRHHDNRVFTHQFIDYVAKVDPSVLPAIEAIGKTATQADAAAFMRDQLGIDVDGGGFARYRNRLKILAACFSNPKMRVPKMRKPYKKRTDTTSKQQTA